MKRPHSFICLVLLLAVFSSCSTKKNTAGTRFWHSFTARFNTYFNGHEAYKEGMASKYEGHRDDYTVMLPVFPESVVKSQSIGGDKFKVAVEKCEKAIAVHSIKRRPQMSAKERKTPKGKLYMQRKEFNPFLKNAWMLMGQAQFAQGNFLEAASTFSYVTRHYAAEPAVASAARSWLARCYAQQNWFYDAEDALSKMRPDSLDRRLMYETEATRADLLIRQGRFADAIPHLQRVVKKVKPARQKARLYFLLGQLNKEVGHNEAAYKAWKKCIKTAPPYEMELNAAILQTEVMAKQPAARKKMVKKLHRMARSENNKDYLDQVYFALGNVHLAENDTAAAVSAYEKGREKSTRNGVEKGVLVLRLAEVYWELRRFADAQGCYTEALGMLDKTRDGFAEATRRSKVLDKLVPYTNTIHLQDSLQALARMGEAERNAAIDRVIELLKKKEEEERKAKEDSIAEERKNGNAGSDAGQQPGQPTPGRPQNPQNENLWYFYNPQLVMQGKQDFKKYWGNRKNEDNWRRSNRAVVALENENAAIDYEAEDSLAAVADSLAKAEEAAESEKPAEADSLKDDPHNREYYLKQIPFSEEARAESDSLLREALIEAGIIEKDDLEDFGMAAETLRRLTREHPAYARTAEAHYHLFLIYSRLGRDAEAKAERASMAAKFPDSEYTRLITAPDYELLARHGREIEDSLYTATYRAYRAGNQTEVQRNFARSTEKFPKGLNRPKFMFVHALSRLGTATTAELIAELRELLKQFPESDVSKMAGMIVKGLESGRQPGTGTLDIGSLWSRRTAAAQEAGLAADSAKSLSPARQVPFVFVVAYADDSVNNNSLLYEMAHFNFTAYSMRGFDMKFEPGEGVTQFRVSGFSSFDEVHAYAQKLMSVAALRKLLKPARLFLISQENLEKIGTLFSYDDYAEFYERNFAPMKLNPELPLEEELPLQRYEDELTPEEIRRLEDKKTDEEEPVDEGEGEWY